MNESHAFDQLKKPVHKLPDDSPTLISDKKWDSMLLAHDEALEVASKSLTAKQKIDNFVSGIVYTIFFIGIAFIMTMPELRAFIGQIFEQLFHAR